MTGRVSLARRNLFADRRRAFLALCGIAAGLLMVILMSGVFTGMSRQQTAYIDQSPADVFLAQGGVHTMYMSTTFLPAETVGRVQALPGVAWAAPLRHATTLLANGDRQVLSNLIGYDIAQGKGGPGTLREGRMPGPRELVLDAAGADQLNVGLGDTVKIGGQPMRISGLSSGLTALAATSAFISNEQFAELSGPGVNWILVGARAGVSADDLATSVAHALPEVSVQTKAQFSAVQVAAVGDLYTDVIRTMMIVGFLITLALVALTLSTVTTSHLRDYGVVRSLGATSTHLTRVVLSQALWAISTALVMATVAAIGLSYAIATWVPKLELVIQPASVLRTAAGAFVVGIPAALMPLRRILRIDPASAFRAG